MKENIRQIIFQASKVKHCTSHKKIRSWTQVQKSFDILAAIYCTTIHPPVIYALLQDKPRVTRQNRYTIQIKNIIQEDFEMGIIQASWFTLLKILLQKAVKCVQKHTHQGKNLHQQGIWQWHPLAKSPGSHHSVWELPILQQSTLKEEPVKLSNRSVRLKTLSMNHKKKKFVERRLP